MLYSKVPSTKIIYDEEEKLHYIVQKRKKKRLGSKQAYADLEAYRKRIAAEKGIDSSKYIVADEDSYLTETMAKEIIEKYFVGIPYIKPYQSPYDLKWYIVQEWPGLDKE